MLAVLSCSVESAVVLSFYEYIQVKNNVALRVKKNNK